MKNEPTPLYHVFAFQESRRLGGMADYLGSSTDPDSAKQLLEAHGTTYHYAHIATETETGLQTICAFCGYPRQYKGNTVYGWYDIEEGELR